MKLLFDQNLSPRLVACLIDAFPDSSHVCFLGLDQATDEVVWDYAHTQDYMLVTKDADFSELSTLRGFPPKVIWLQQGNCSTAQVEDLLRRHLPDVEQLATNEGIGILSLV